MRERQARLPREPARGGAQKEVDTMSNHARQSSYSRDRETGLANNEGYLDPTVAAAIRQASFRRGYPRPKQRPDRRPRTLVERY